MKLDALLLVAALSAAGCLQLKLLPAAARAVV